MAENKIVIVEYREEWKSDFDKERSVLHRIFATDLLYIEHVGSTSIPGLAAKPVIDIMIGMDVFTNLRHYRRKLESVGYREIETGMSGRVFFRKENGGFHLHVLPCEDFYERNEILFRDFLRKNRSLMDEYAELKRILASKMDTDHAGYTQAKTDFIQKVVDLARDERGLPRQKVWES